MVFAKAFENAKKRKQEEPPSASSSAAGNNKISKEQRSMKEQASQNNNGEPKDDQQEIRKRRRGRKRSSKAEAQETSLGTNKDLTLNLKNSSSRIQQQKQHLDEKPKKKRKKVSQEALSLSSELKELSQKKLMRQALDLYWEPKYEKVRDGFHACIVIDCCARCGDMSEAERIIKEVKRTGRIVNVETKTALIKGYSHNGDMPRAAQIFEQMCQEKNPEQQPNVRTLNTFLRGCLWTAAVVSNKDQIVGGVTSAERTWKLFQNLTEKKDVQTDSDSIKSVDISSYEYLISLLCQALRIDDATKRIKELKDAYGISFRKNSFLGGDHTVLETLAVSYLGLGRAHALLGHKKDGLEACKFARNAIHKSREMLATDHSRGEKRAWKTTEDTSRAFSNQAYRDHRLSELELNVRSIEEVCESDNFPPPGTVLARRFVNGLFYFSGGGTTQKDTAKSTSEKQLEGRLLRRHLVNSSWLSFGLSTAIQGENFDFSCPSSTDFVRVKLSERIFREIGQSTSAVQDDGFIDFSGLFSDSTKPLDVEIGAGHGDWIVHQAAKRRDRNHIAVELRADRVAQIFAKGVLQVSGPLENLCVVGDESNAFLTQRLRPGSASNIFVNHPEPPTQAFGEDDSDLRAIMNGADEPAHMLSSSALMSAATCLIDQGQIVVVTDNKCYARLLAATVLKVNRKNNVKLQSVKFPTKSSGLRVIEDFSKHGKGRGELSVLLYEGQPCEAIGHALVESRDGRGSSYFDRLWRTGASNHASQRERYILVLKKA